MEKQLLKKSGIIAVIVTFGVLAAWFGFVKISLGIDTSNWTYYNIRKDSVVSERLIIMCGTSGSDIIFGTTSAQWVGTPTDSTLARIGLNTGTGKLEIKNAGTDTPRPIVKYHDDLMGITANQHHNQVHGASDHSGNIGTESQITFGPQTGHAHTGTDSAKVQHSQLAGITANDHHPQVHGASDHSGNIGTESQITLGTQTGHAHTGTDSTKVSYPNLLNRSHGAADHSGNIGTESQITFAPQTGHAHTGIDSTKIDYNTVPVRLGVDTTGNSDNIAEGNTNKYYTDARVNSVIGSSSMTSPQGTPKITLTSPASGQFLKIVDASGNVENGTSSSTVSFSAITGTPTDNTNFSTTPDANKILVARGNGKIPWSWLDGELPLASLENVTTATNTAFTDAGTVNDTASQILLHFDGPNGTTTFVNSGYGTMSITAVDNAQISTLAAKFGVSSGIFDGITDRVTIATSPLLTIPANTKWDLSMQINPDVISSNDGLFALGIVDVIALDLKISNLELTIGTITINTPAPVVGAWTQVYVSYDGKVGRLFKGGNQVGTATLSDTVSFTDAGNGAFIGEYAGGGGGYTFDGYLDEFRFRVNPDVNFYTSNFGSNTVAYTGSSLYNERTVSFFDASDNILMMKFVSPGTATAEKSYTFFPGSVTVFGGTGTTVIGTTTPGLAYGVPGKGASTFDAQNVHSVDEIKSGLESLAGKENESRNKVLKMQSKSWHPKVRDISPEDAEDAAKEEYIRKDYMAWEVINKSKYIVSIEMAGTGTVQIFNIEKMIQDFKTEREISWASDLNQTKLIIEKHADLESDTSITRRGFRVRDPLTPEEIKEGNAINLMSLSSMIVDTIKAQDAEIGSLTAALENQKIAYNEEIDNLYNRIEAVILGLIGVGGVGGWTTIRRKRKGT